MKVNILYLIDTLETVGGTERQLFEIVTRLDKEKYTPYIISLGNAGPFSNLISSNGVYVENLSLKKVYGAQGIKTCLRLIKFIKSKNISIIHTFHFGAQLLGLALAKITKRPLIVSVRDLGFWQEKRHRLIKKCIDNLADKIFVVSEAVKHNIMGSSNVKKDKIVVIYNGVDTDKFSRNIEVEKYKLSLKLDLEKPCIGYIGWLRREKGLQYFLEAAKKVKEANCPAQFVIIGDGILKDWVKTQVIQLGLNDMVHLLGDRKDIPELLAILDICVLPSLTEGFSNTLIEAMAAGKPVIATNVGGNMEAIVHEESGLLVPIQDSDKLASAIIRLLKDQALKVRLGRSAKVRAQEKFNIKNAVLQHQEFYDSLIA